MHPNLLTIHVHASTGGQPEGCTCPRSACGGAEQSPGIQDDGCTAHGAITATRHRAFECPQLPADTDLSRLWIIVTKWTADGPVPLGAYQFDRVLLADLRGSSTMWDVSEGDTADDAVRAWQDHVDAMRAAAGRRQAAAITDAQQRALARKEATAALLSPAARAARRTPADPGDR